MTNEEAIRILQCEQARCNERTHSQVDYYMSDKAFDMAKNALETLSAIDSIINREDSLIGRAQEDVIRYQMICKVMQTRKEGEEE